jgi:hypothetical protein
MLAIAPAKLTPSLSLALDLYLSLSLILKTNCELLNFALKDSF